MKVFYDYDAALKRKEDIIEKGKTNSSVYISSHTVSLARNYTIIGENKLKIILDGRVVR